MGYTSGKNVTMRNVITEIVMMGNVIAGIWMHGNVSLLLAVMILRDFARAQGCRGQTARPAIPWRREAREREGGGSSFCLYNTRYGCMHLPHIVV